LYIKQGIEFSQQKIKPLNRSSPAKIANQAKEPMQVTQPTVVADKGYYSGKQIKDCMDLGVTPIMPKY
jgi:hypothetical protein